MLIAIRFGRKPGFSFEEGGEMVLRFESEFFRNLADGLVGINKQGLRFFHTKAQMIFGRCFAGMFLKRLPEPCVADV